MQAPLNDRTQVMTAAMAADGLRTGTFLHVLVVLEGLNAGMRLRLGERPLVIGRGEACDARIPDSQVSGRHCEVGVVPAAGEVVVRDLGSTNGTFVDGRRVQGTARLLPGSLLRLGTVVLRHDLLTAEEASRADEQEQDLEKARRYVESLLPPRIPDGPVQTDWHYEPSAKLGGDAFGYHRLSGQCFAGYLMDISGHGVGAAMHSVSVMNVMRQRALPDVDFHDPSQVLRSLNAMFQMDSHNGMYFTMWYGVYDVQRRCLRYASAGHHPAYLVSPEGTGMQPLRTRNLMIGAVPDLEFQAAEVQVPPGSQLYVFSDGVFEVVRSDGSQGSIDDFLPLLQDPTAAREAATLFARVRAAARPGPLDDDFTLLAVKFPSQD